MDAYSKVIPFELHPLGFIEAFVHFGADIDALLENTGIHRRMINVGGYKISYHQQSTLIANGLKLCRKPGLGYLVGQYMDWSYNGTVGQVVSCAPSLAAAGAAMRRYLCIAQPYYAIYTDKPNIFVDAEGMIMMPIRYYADLHSNADVHLFEKEYRIAVMLRLLEACGNHTVDNTTVKLYLTESEPSHSDIIRQLPTDQIIYNADLVAVAAHHEFVRNPWREMRLANFERVTEKCEAELRDMDLDITLSKKVRWYISLYFNEEISLEQISEKFHLTPRAMTRRLATENTSFRQIVHQVRMEITCYHLQESKLNIETIAEIMGFSNVSSLRRAVKNWSGETVAELRDAG